MFLQQISSQPSYIRKDFFLTLNMLVLDNKTVIPTISLSSTLLNFTELITSTIFDGYTGIQNTNEMDVYCPNHSY